MGGICKRNVRNLGKATIETNKPTKLISIPIPNSPENECNFMISMSCKFPHAMLGYADLTCISVGETASFRLLG